MYVKFSNADLDYLALNGHTICAKRMRLRKKEKKRTGMPICLRVALTHKRGVEAGRR